MLQLCYAHYSKLIVKTQVCPAGHGNRMVTQIVNNQSNNMMDC